MFIQAVRVKRNMTADEWKRFVADDIDYELTCGDFIKKSDNE